MRRRPRILVDIDGFFANFIARSLPVIKSLVGNVGDPPRVISDVERARIEALTHDDVRSYRMEEICDMTPDEIAAWHFRVKGPGYCALIPPYDGARECVAALQELGDVHPVTFPWKGSPHWIIEREAWLADKLGIDPDLVVYTKQKHLVSGDIFLEDTTRYLIEWRQHHPDGVGIRMRRPYNAHESYDGITVETFDQVVSAVREAIELREAHHRELWNNI